MPLSYFPCRNLRAPALSVALALSLGGCAVSPLPQWKPEKLPDEVTLTEAKGYARSLRERFQQRLDSQVRQQGALSSSLLGLGAVATAAAIGGANSNVYGGLALLGGTSYAFGQQNLRSGRLGAYIAGIEALNCALAIVTPLDVSQAHAQKIDASLAALDEALKQQRVAMGAVSVLHKTLDAAQADLMSSLKLRLDAAEALARSATLVRDNAVALRGKQQQAGRELVNAVDRVRTEVDKALLQTLPDLSAVTATVAGLGPLADRFLPGANIAQRLGKSQEALGAAQAGVGSKLNEKSADPKLSRMVAGVRQALSALDKADADLDQASSTLRTQVAGMDPATDTAALRECKAAGVVAPLVTSNSELHFSGAGKEETQSVVVSGGNKPYVVDLQSGRGSGLSVRSPAPFDSRFDVTAAANATAGSYAVLVQDSSSPVPRSITIPVHVGADDGSGEARRVSLAGTDGNPKTLEDFALLLEPNKSFKGPKGNRYAVVTKRSPSPGVLSVLLKCTPAAGKPTENESDVRDLMVGSPPQLLAAYQDAISQPQKQLLLAVQPASCIKKGA